MLFFLFFHSNKLLKLSGPGDFPGTSPPGKRITEYKNNQFNELFQSGAPIDKNRVAGLPARKQFINFTVNSNSDGFI
jgi:hypothetical protein